MATTDYMGPLILAVYLFLIFAMGLQFGLLSLFLSQPLRWNLSLAIASSWVLFEWLRLFFLCGFTWNPVGLSLSDSPYSLQFASIWGIFGLSFWVILTNLTALRASLEKNTKTILTWASLALFPYLFGLVHQYWIETNVPFSGTLNVALVQTGIYPEQKDRLSSFSDRHIPPQLQWERILGVLDLQKNVDLLVLPEAALPLGAHGAGYEFTSIKKYFKESSLPPLQSPYALFTHGSWKVNNVFILQALANELGAHVIAGLEDADFAGRYNAAFHFNPKNLFYERYEKRILVPIGEYIPCREWQKFSRFVANQFGIYSSFDAGTEAKIFKAQFPIGISICLEETFSNLTRDLRLQGAEIFVNLTNDVWFPRSKLPRQHFDHGRIRAAENGVSILRACNTGITGGIDCFGNPLEQIPISEQKASSLYFVLPVRSYPTLYTFWGDGAILGISVASLLSYFVLARKSCRK